MSGGVLRADVALNCGLHEAVSTVQQGKGSLLHPNNARCGNTIVRNQANKPAHSGTPIFCILGEGGD